MKQLLFLSVLAAGCFGGLNGVTVVHDMSGPSGNDDMPGGNGKDASGNGGHDAGGNHNADMTSVVVQACPLPHLQVLARDYSGNNASQILRLPLNGSATCQPLSLSGSLSADANAIGWFPPSTTIFGEIDGKLRFINDDDTEAAAPYTPTDHRNPDSIFWLNDGTQKRIVIGYDVGDDPLPTTLSYFDVLDANDWSKRAARWPIGVTDASDLIRTSVPVPFADRDPFDATKLFVLTQKFESPDPTFIFDAPFDGSAKTGTTYVQSLDDNDDAAYMRTLSYNGAARTAWIFTPSQLTSDPNPTIKVVHRSEGSGQPKQWGPITCKAGSQCDDPLGLYDAVPDFTTDDGILALCMIAQSNVTGEATSNVIRIHSNGTCETLFQGDSLVAGMTLTALSTALAE